MVVHLKQNSTEVIIQGWWKLSAARRHLGVQASFILLYQL